MQRALRHALFVTSTLVVGAGTLAAQAQQQGEQRTLSFTSASEAARTATYNAAVDFFNIYFERSAMRAREGMTLDPNLGMARALYAWANPPGLTAAQREQELNRAVADAARNSTPELLATMMIRALALNRANEANVFIDAMIALLPDDPVPQYLKATRSNEPAEVVANLEAFVAKFSDFAPAHNILAYQRWATGDRDGALAAVQEYVRLAPDHPNSHDSYAEILQFMGRLPEALQHYERAIAIDRSYAAAPVGVAEVHLLMGHASVARDAYMKAADVASAPAARLNTRGMGALTHALEGKAKDAIREMNAIASIAETQNLKPQAANYHRTSALIEALLGDRRQIDGHLAKAAELGGAEAPAQLRFTALAYAAVGQIEAARTAAAKYAAATANGTAAQQRTAREVNAVVAAAEKDFARAQSELSEAGDAATIGRAIVADALSKAGRKAEAQALKAEVTGSTTATPLDILARAKVRSL
ncbi:MAG: hypothetical protein ACREOK_11675 [Gemmatimonadaceae bacterium]